uniref:Uncharacterized protein n=1 Tax=Fundulus heteroclitus TaxID=8078 RepID=A0A3Q2PEL3_FUNHE
MPPPCLNMVVAASRCGVAFLKQQQGKKSVPMGRSSQIQDDTGGNLLEDNHNHNCKHTGRIFLFSLFLLQDDQTPLHISSRLGKPDIVQQLLAKGACPDNGYTPLHIAAKKNQMEIATTLLEYSASTSTVTRQGITPLHLAAQEGNVDIVTLLLARDAPVGTSNKVRHTDKSEKKTIHLTVLGKGGLVFSTVHDLTLTKT